MFLRLCEQGEGGRVSWKTNNDEHGEGGGGVAKFEQTYSMDPIPNTLIQQMELVCVGFEIHPFFILTILSFDLWYDLLHS